MSESTREASMRGGEGSDEPEASAPDAPGEGEPSAPREPRREGSSSEPVGGTTSRLSRIATGALNVVTTAGAATDPRQQPALVARLRKFMVPIGVLLFLLLLFGLFHEILLPFILALVIVFLMEPLVSRVGKTQGDPRGIPRWVAVILVYVIFFGIVTTAVVLIVPRFVSEIVRFGETVPEEVQRFRTEQLPSLNERLQGFVKEYVPPLDAPSSEQGAKLTTAVGAASAALHEGRRQSAALAVALPEARARVELAANPEITWDLAGDPGFEERVFVATYPERVHQALRAPLFNESGGSWAFAEDYQAPAFRVMPAEQGGYAFYMGDVDLEIEPLSNNKGWRVRRAPMPQAPGELVGESVDEEGGDQVTLHAMLDLEQGLDDLIEEAITSSNARIASLITVAQELVVGIIQAFVALILTLMVAAFITIDLHAVMDFFRNLIPPEHRESYDELLSEMDRGLSGVVRGQLMICLINGVLTYIGLVLLGIKFSLLLAVVAGVLSLIPIFGTILSTIPIVLFGLTDGLMTGVFGLLWVLGIHFVEANILNPKIIGTSAHIHPVIVIFALLAGESAFGLVGALLAVPTASILLTLFRFFVMRGSAQGQRAVERMDDEIVANRPKGVS